MEDVLAGYYGGNVSKADLWSWAGVATPTDWPVVDGVPSGAYRHRSRKLSITLQRFVKDYTLQVTDLRVMQFDIIVKDTDASPDTGWVFTTRL
jgi:hypothetical protein